MSKELQRYPPFDPLLPQLLARAANPDPASSESRSGGLLVDGAEATACDDRDAPSHLSVLHSVASRPRQRASAPTELAADIAAH